MKGLASFQGLGGQTYASRAEDMASGVTWEALDETEGSFFFCVGGGGSRATVDLPIYRLTDNLPIDRLTD